MTTAKVFRSGNSQAVRLPKKFRLRAREVIVKRIGDVLLLVPKGDPWQSFETSLSMFSDDFMSERGQPGIQRRKGL